MTAPDADLTCDGSILPMEMLMEPFAMFTGSREAAPEPSAEALFVEIKKIFDKIGRVNFFLFKGCFTAPQRGFHSSSDLDFELDYSSISLLQLIPLIRHSLLYTYVHSGCQKTLVI